MGQTRRTSELQIHTVLAWIAQANHDDNTAEVELRTVLSIDPAQTASLHQLGETILREIAATGDVARYPEAMQYLKQSGATTTSASETLLDGLLISATVVSQQSANRILVNLGNAPQGNAILLFDAVHIGAIRPGATLQFRGVLDSYTTSPATLTFVIRNPKTDIAWLNNNRPKHANILARVFRGLFHFVGHLA